MEASLYRTLEDGRVQCFLCAHGCIIEDGGRGVCRVRRNQGGILETLVYGRSISANIDPIEKKPLFHFYPGSRAFSVATPGCNFRCDWCQNWQISQLPRERELIAGQELTPAAIVAAAEQGNCRSIAYTYTEPTIFYEYSAATGRLARDQGIANVYVSNGYMSTEMLDLSRSWLDAANIDLKAFRDETYRKYIGARLAPVLDSLKRIRAFGIWLEVTTLVIPGINDDPQELRDMADFIAEELGPEVPWHISRFFPQYKMNRTEPTPPATLRRAQEIGHEAGLNYVYLGNLGGNMETRCPGCGAVVISRGGPGHSHSRLDSFACCPQCATRIAGIGLDRLI